MSADRHAILSLVAMGRITAAEAERLLAVWNESRETAWIVGLCLACACLAQLQPQELLPLLIRLSGGQIPVLGGALHHALMAIMNLLGGVL